MTSITVILHDAKYTFIITSCSVLLTISNVSDKNYRENQNTHFTTNSFFDVNTSLKSDGHVGYQDGNGDVTVAG